MKSSKKMCIHSLRSGHSEGTGVGVVLSLPSVLEPAKLQLRQRMPRDIGCAYLQLGCRGPQSHQLTISMYSWFDDPTWMFNFFLCKVRGFEGGEEKRRCGASSRHKCRCNTGSRLPEELTYWQSQCGRVSACVSSVWVCKGLSIWRGFALCSAEAAFVQLDPQIDELIVPEAEAQQTDSATACSENGAASSSTYIKI